MKGITMVSYKSLIAKTDSQDQNLGLPLWIHLKDTGGIMKKLIYNWVSDATVSATGLSESSLFKVAVFCACLHDIGKATAYFQSLIINTCPNQIEPLKKAGYIIPESNSFQKGKTPHAWAGQWILQSDICSFHIPDGIADIIGAHHGNPIEISFVNSDPDLIHTYPYNFYGTYTDSDTKQRWHDSWKNLFEQAKNEAGIDNFSDIPALSIEAQTLITALVIVADWIASNTTYFPLYSFNDLISLTDDDCIERVEYGWTKLNFPELWHSKTNIMEISDFILI